MKYLGIIFDFNGVLWWDSHLQELAWIQFAQQVWGRSLSEAELAREVHGRYNRHTLGYLAGAALSEEQVEQLSQRKERIYQDLCLAQGAGFQLSPGAVELLDSLLAHRIPRTIATASGPENLAFFFRHLGLERWFEIDCIAHDDGTVPGKPAPDIYLRAARALGLQPGSFVVVEDSGSGLRSAHAAGVGYLVALGPPASHPHLARLPGVAQVVETLVEIPWQRLFL